MASRSISPTSYRLVTHSHSCVGTRAADQVHALGVSEAESCETYRPSAGHGVCVCVCVPLPSFLLILAKSSTS